MTSSISTERAQGEPGKRRLLWPLAVMAVGALGLLLAWLGMRRRAPRVGVLSPRGDSTGAARYVGDAACRRCHAAIALTYSRHPMGQSLAPIEHAAGPPGGSGGERVEFEAGGLVYSVEPQGSRVVHHEMRRDPSGQVVAEIQADVQYAIGSGRQGVSYLIERDGFLFESPITWYAKDHRFGLSPGYETRTSRFDRPVMAECLFCHANRVERHSSAHQPIPDADFSRTRDRLRTVPRSGRVARAGPHHGERSRPGHREPCQS